MGQTIGQAIGRRRSGARGGRRHSKTHLTPNSFFAIAPWLVHVSAHVAPTIQLMTMMSINWKRLPSMAFQKDVAELAISPSLRAKGGHQRKEHARVGHPVRRSQGLLGDWRARRQRRVRQPCREAHKLPHDFNCGLYIAPVCVVCASPAISEYMVCQPPPRSLPRDQGKTKRS